MAQFKFRENNLKLEIEDEVFYLDIAGFNDSDRLIKIGEDALQISKKGNNPETVKELMDMLVEAIDTILGEGSVARIFKKRKINYLDLIDLLAFITEEINSFRSERLKGIYSVNRKDELIN